MVLCGKLTLLTLSSCAWNHHFGLVSINGFLGRLPFAGNHQVKGIRAGSCVDVLATVSYRLGGNRKDVCASI